MAGHALADAAIDMRLGLAEWLADPSHGVPWLTTIVSHSLTMSDDSPTVRAVGERFLDVVQRGTLYAVGRDTSDLVMGAARKLPRLLSWPAEQTPSPAGVMMLPHGVHAVASPKAKVPIEILHGFVWFRAADMNGVTGWVVSPLNVSPEWTGMAARAQRPATREWIERGGSVAAPLSVFLIPDESLGAQVDLSWEDHQGILWLMAAWAWSTSFADVTDDYPSRAVGRRAARQSGGSVDPVRVIRLPRRHSGPSAGSGEHPVDWKNRWIVSGHWRRQPYPSLGITKTLWIAPYVKGPEDRPLLIRDDVNVLGPPR